MNSKRTLAAVAFVLMAIIASFASTEAAFASGGSSANVRVCQNGGWKFWLRADQTAFKTQGDCVTYAAKGGTLTSPYPAAQSLCEGFGGTFGHNDQLSGDPTRQYLWTCNDLPADFPFPSGNDQLASQCFADGASGPFAYNPETGASTCFTE